MTPTKEQMLETLDRLETQIKFTRVMIELGMFRPHSTEPPLLKKREIHFTLGPFHIHDECLSLYDDWR